MKLHIEKTAVGNSILIDYDTGNAIAIVADIAAFEKLVAEHSALVAVAEAAKDLISAMTAQATIEPLSGFNVIREFHRADNALANLAAVKTK